MCYLHLRLLGFLPIFLPTGWVIHEDGLHEKREEIEKITSREGELEEEFQAVTKGGYRGMLGPHIWVEGVCDLVTGIGWWGVVESCRRVICSRAYEPRSQGFFLFIARIIIIYPSLQLLLIIIIICYSPSHFLPSSFPTQWNSKLSSTPKPTLESVTKTSPPFKASEPLQKDIFAQKKD